MEIYKETTISLEVSIKMGICVSKRHTKERAELLEYLSNISEQSRQFVAIHNQLTSVTTDITSAWRDNVSTIEQVHNTLDNRCLGIRSELRQISRELREIGNTSRIRAGGLPQIPLDHFSEINASDCESIHSAASNLSRSRLGIKSYSVEQPVRPCVLVKKDDHTLTRNMDTEGYMLPSTVHRV